MLNLLHIQNFAIINHSEVQFKSGMTTITGETGAGKSILLFALDIVLGARVDKTFLHSTKHTEICATFDIDNIPNAKRWLIQQDLTETQDSECILRRKINPAGKSKAYINGTLVTLAQIKELATLLISIYSQHAHHALLQKENQLERLDIYAAHAQLLDDVKQSALRVATLEQTLKTQQSAQQHLSTQKALLEYQYQELNELNLNENEVEMLEQEHDSLANAEQQISSLHQCAHMVYEDDNNITSQISNTIATLQNIPAQTPAINNTIKLLQQAEVYSQEAYQEIVAALGELEVNPEKLAQVESRISECHDIARKHHIDIKQLYPYISHISNALQQIQDQCQDLAILQDKLRIAKEAYSIAAQKLSHSRSKNAKPFAKAIEAQIQQLNIPNGKFHIELTQIDRTSPYGFDLCEYQISFNQGQLLAPLNKVASGGELSRIGLAIQVISSQKIAPPTILFDEVDVGISGGTAEVVGRLLQKLSHRAQVICITHQAQVAAQGQQHLHIAKDHHAKKTASQVIELSNDQRIEEIARIIGGIEITEQTMAHATEMLGKLQRTQEKTLQES
jgi:DNA repair protein RecN (Recombination protein N)